MNTRVRVTGIPALVAASFGIGIFGRTLAQDATAGAKPAGFDEITLKVEDSGVTGMPESVAAGRYLVNVTGPEPGEMGPSGAIFLQLPDGKTPEQAFEDIQSAQGNPPDWYMDAHFGGGAVLAQGTESWAVVDLTPGTWIATTPYGSTLGVQFEVTGDMPADLAEPEANVTVELMEMVINVADGAFVAGDNVVTVKNIGATLHFLDVSKIPDGATKDDVAKVFDAMMSGGTPPAGLSESDMVPVESMPEQSPKVQQTLPLTLEAGTYMLACWVTDPESGMPHAMMGMYDVVTVK